MPEVGDKFLIEIGEVYETLENSASANDEQTGKPTFLYRIKGFNSLVFDEDGLSKLQQVNIETAQELAYQRGLKDAREAAIKICTSECNGGLSCDVIKSIFGTWTFDGISRKNTASEVIEKIKAFEEQKKAKEEEIKVGDEVVGEFGFHGVVVGIDLPSNKASVLDTIHSVPQMYPLANLRRKTDGRQFPQIAELLKLMQEE